MTDIILAATPEHIATARELFLEYQRWLNLDLCFQNFSAELAALPGDYAPPSGRLLLALRVPLAASRSAGWMTKSAK
jgi:putative acetyltransferase